MQSPVITSDVGSAVDTRAPIPVCRPQLPRAADVARFLARLDETRHYSNHGALLAEFEMRLVDLLGLQREGLTLTSSGTTALLAALLGAAGRASAARPLCLIAGYGFVAAPLAGEQAGYRPYFVDVCADDWMIDADRLARHPALARTGAVIVTAPYGRAFSMAVWDAFTDATGVPVVVDAAAGLEAVVHAPDAMIGRSAMILSFHATKAFGVGEGGAVISADAALMRRVRAAANFGFDASRETVLPGTNGKMSEYHAAVGLAALEAWPQRLAGLSRVAGDYDRFAAEHCLRVHTAPSVSGCYVLLEAESATQAQAWARALEAASVGYRFWYGRGLHRERYFATASSDRMDNTEQVAARVVGLPTFPDLPTELIQRIVATVAASR